MGSEIKVINQPLIDAILGLSEIEKGTGYKQNQNTELINHSRGKMFEQINDTYKALGSVEDQFINLVKKTDAALGLALKKFDDADHAGLFDKAVSSLGSGYEGASGVIVGVVSIDSHGNANYRKIDAKTLDQRIEYTNANGRKIGYYVPSNGCTWYAAARYRQVNGAENDLKFSKAGGDAKNWPNSIDKSRFSVSDTTDYSAIKPNSIAVSTENDYGVYRGEEAKDSYGNYIQASGNHVCYIEDVRDGYVYYSQGSFGKDPSTYGQIIKVPIEKFAQDYEKIITAI